MEIYVKEDSFCPGVDHPEGKPLTKEFLLREYGNVIDEARKVLR